MTEGENIYAIEISVTRNKTKFNLDLFAIQFVLHFFAPKISNKSVHSETDNYNTPLIVASGSNKAHLQILADDIYVLIIKHSVVLQVKWIP